MQEYINEPLIVIGILLFFFGIDRFTDSIFPKFHSRIIKQLKLMEIVSILLYLYLHFHFLPVFQEYKNYIVVLTTIHRVFARFTLINLFFLMIPMQRHFGIFKLPFHRVLGRLAIMWGCLHGTTIIIIKIFIQKKPASWFFDLSQTNFVFGPLLLFFLSLMGFHSIRFIRRKKYFIFYIAHMLIAPVVIVFLWLHLHEEFYLFTLPLTVTFFFVVLRWISFKRIRIISTESSHSFTRLETEKIPNSNDGGDHVKLYCRKLGLLESHPFTFFNKKNSSVFLIKAYKGWTNRLKLKIAERLLTNFNISNINKSYTLRYSGPMKSVLRNVKNYDHLILFGAGGGMTPMLSALNIVASNQFFCKKIKRIELFLSSRAESDMDFMEKEINKIIQDSPITDLKDKVFLHRFVTGINGRPKIKEEILKLIEKKKTYGFFFCGPYLMTLKLRSILASVNVSNGFRINQFYLESEY